MENDRYLLSFTGASLSLSESIVIAEVYLQLEDWEAVERKVKSENLVKARTNRSIQRVYQELAPRLKALSDEQIRLLVESSVQEQKQILWYAVCKRYAFIREFATEVLHEKFLRFDYTLTDLDYDSFFNRKADWHPELDNLSETTRKKMKSRIFWMLREAEIISEDGNMIPTIFSPRVQQALAPDAPVSVQVFPTTLP
jgi:hypothetical protein